MHNSKKQFLNKLYEWYVYDYSQNVNWIKLDYKNFIMRINRLLWGREDIGIDKIVEIIIIRVQMTNNKSFTFLISHAFLEASYQFRAKS